MSKIAHTLFSDKEVEICEGSNKDNYIMAIESSCDETACAIVKNGREVIANVVASQIDIHKEYGGVIPEIAAREHLNSINPVIEEALAQSKLNIEDITAFAGTTGPGLVGCLLVGLNAAKTLALVHDKPFIGVNHLKAHICANYIDTDLKPPYMALLISGGHTQIIEVKSHKDINIIGETIDDAVGEAFDKVARLLGLPYPGGVKLDKMAQQGNPNAFHFPISKVDGYDFSFSGLKTAALRQIKALEGQDFSKEDFCASFQNCIAQTLLKKVKSALVEYPYKQVVLAGGVAANSEIRKVFLNLENEGYKTFIPQLKYCTDNASMVASCAYFFEDILDNIDVEVFSRFKH